MDSRRQQKSAAHSLNSLLCLQHFFKSFLFNCNSSLLNDLPKDWRNKLIAGIEKAEADNILDEEFIRQLLDIIQEPVIRTRISEVLENLDRRYVAFKKRQ